MNEPLVTLFTESDDVHWPSVGIWGKIMAAWGLCTGLSQFCREGPCEWSPWYESKAESSMVLFSKFFFRIASKFLTLLVSLQPGLVCVYPSVKFLFADCFWYGVFKNDVSSLNSMTTTIGCGSQLNVHEHAELHTVTINPRFSTCAFLTAQSLLFVAAGWIYEATLRSETPVTNVTMPPQWDLWLTFRFAFR